MKNKYYTSRDPIKNYFPLPNEVFALGLSPGALAVYSYLMYIEDRTTYQCHASYRTIGNAVILHRKADVDRGAASGVGLLHGYRSRFFSALSCHAQPTFLCS